MLLRRDVAVDLLIRRGELTQREAEAIVADPLFLPGGAELEDDFYVKRRRFHCGLNVLAGGAGFRSQVGLFNASGQGTAVVIVIERHWFSSDAVFSTPTVRQYQILTGFSSATVPHSDTQWAVQQWGIPPASPLRITPIQLTMIFQNTAAVIAGSNGQTMGRSLANVTNVFDLPMVLAPQTGIAWDPNADNVACTVGFAGYMFEMLRRA